MASAHWRSGTRGRPPPKRWVFTCLGSSGARTAQRVSEMRKPVVVRLLGVRARVRFVGTVCSLMPEVYRVIRIGTKVTPLSIRRLAHGIPIPAAQGSARILPVGPDQGRRRAGG